MNRMLIGALGAVCTASVADAAVEYTFSRFAPPASGFNTVLSINDRGQAVGNTVNNQSFFFDGVLWGAPDDPNPQFLSDVFGATKVNSAGMIESDGTILGAASFTRPGEGPQRAAIYHPDGRVEMLAAPPIGSASDPSVAFDRNATGMVVGNVILNGPGVSRAMWWDSKGGTHLIPTLPGFNHSQASSVADNGTVIGSTANTRLQRFAYYVWTPDGGTRRATPFYQGNRDVILSEISSTGLIAGATANQDDTFFLPAIWDNPDEAPTLLPLLDHAPGAVAKGINSHGDAVGLFLDGNDGLIKPALWTDGEMIDLTAFVDDPNVVLEEATRITDGGRILVRGFDTAINNVVYGVFTPIPGPGSGAALALAALSMGGRRRRRRG